MAIVFVDGKLLEESKAKISVFDHGVVAGDGVFEALAVYDGVPFALNRHLTRLAKSVLGVGLSTPDVKKIEAAVYDVIGANKIDFGKVRITYTAGDGPLGSERLNSAPRIIVASAPMSPVPPVARVSIAPWPRNEFGVLAGLKTTSYAENVVALAWAKRQGSSEVIFRNTQDLLCEGSGSNIFVVIGNRLVTPPLSSGCLAGVTRDLIVEFLGAVEEDIPMTLLKTKSISEAFLSSSLREAQAITHFDDFEMKNAPGPYSISVASAFRELIKENQNP